MHLLQCRLPAPPPRLPAPAQTTHPPAPLPTAAPVQAPSPCRPPSGSPPRALAARPRTAAVAPSTSGWWRHRPAAARPLAPGPPAPHRDAAAGGGGSGGQACAAEQRTSGRQEQAALITKQQDAGRTDDPPPPPFTRRLQQLTLPKGGQASTATALEQPHPLPLSTHGALYSRLPGKFFLAPTCAALRRAWRLWDALPCPRPRLAASQPARGAFLLLISCPAVPRWLGWPQRAAQ